MFDKIFSNAGFVLLIVAFIALQIASYVNVSMRSHENGYALAKCESECESYHMKGMMLEGECTCTIKPASLADQVAIEAPQSE